MALSDLIAELPQRLFRTADNVQTETVTIPTTSPFTHALGTGAPFNNPPGYPVVPPAIANNVTISGGGHSAWTQVAPGSALAAGQFSVDTTTSPTGGTLQFSSADAGLAVSVQWIGSNLVNEKLLGTMLAAFTEVLAERGAPNGLALLGSDGRLPSAMAASYPTLGTGTATLTFGPAAGTSPNFRGTSGGASAVDGTNMRGSFNVDTGASPHSAQPSGDAFIHVAFSVPLPQVPHFIQFGGGFSGGGGVGSLMSYIPTYNNLTVNGFDITTQLTPGGNLSGSWQAIL